MSFIAYNQTDSLKYKRGYVGGNFSFAVNQMNFSGLRKYTYLLNQPPNYGGGMDIMLYAGVPDKIFATLSFNRLFQLNPQSGDYNKYSLSVQYSYLALGISATVPIYHNLNNEVVKRVYYSIGVQSVAVDLSAKAIGNGAVGDTSFNYEDSEVKKIVLNTEVMFDLFSFGKNHKEYANDCVTLKIGYNFQFGHPWWSGTYYRNPGDENPNVNLGGFYVTIGINVWYLTQKK